MVSKAIKDQWSIDSDLVIKFDNLHRICRSVPPIIFTHNQFLPEAYKHAGRDDPIEWLSEFAEKRVVFLLRHPIDTCVSQYFQWKFRSKDENIRLKGWPSTSSNLTLFEFMDHPLTGVKALCDTINFWLGNREKIPRFHVVQYEEISADAAKCLQELFDFFEIEIAPEIIKRAAAYGSFDNLRQIESDGALRGQGMLLTPGDSANVDSFKVRRGKIKGYTDYLSTGEVSYFEDVVDAMLDPKLGYCSSDSERSAMAPAKE